MSYSFHPAAEAEHLESVAFYESKQPGLGAAYLAEFENAMKRVCEAKHRYPIEGTGYTTNSYESLPIHGIISRKGIILL